MPSFQCECGGGYFIGRMSNMNPWWKQKTTWTCVVAIVTATGLYLTGEITFIVFLQTILAAFGGIFLRQAVTKNGSSGK